MVPAHANPLSIGSSVKLPGYFKFLNNQKRWKEKNERDETPYPTQNTAFFPLNAGSSVKS
ncbi:hypothetical protein Mapa_013013 [Marchantia paleacea]|nr:hypothetical protein Mapa_013013 [Marchantia paleacea]